MSPGIREVRFLTVAAFIVISFFIVSCSSCSDKNKPPDSDYDGIYDYADNCPQTFNPLQKDSDKDGIGDACEIAQDSDGDGIADPDDNCPAVSNQDQADTDGDNVGDACDNCPADQSKTEPGICGCGESDTDSDGDGTLDCNDVCPDDPAKTIPGVCGCGNSDKDSDNDGILDCNDNCPNDPNKAAPGVCGCGILDVDSDSDGTADCNDGCPNDPDKIVAGACGCGIAETDSDGDNTPDCNDNCPGDPNKIEPEICGCGVFENDTDSDGTPDCNDFCPDDQNKIVPGECGCGVPDADQDDDGISDCNDNCPDDPDKNVPGICGCGISDTDSDGDGTPDCIDEGDSPVADAGDDTEYILAPGASTDVLLDGTGSSDPDGTIVSFTWTGSPDPDDIVQPTVNLSAGVYTFTLVVTDNDANESEPDTLTITVIESSENIAPNITSMPLTVASVDYEYVYPVIANDPNGDTLNCSLITYPEGMTVDESAVVRWTPTGEQVADHQVSLQMDDGAGGMDTQTYWIRVSQANSAAGNTPPIAYAGDEMTVEESTIVALDGTYSFDADDDHLQFNWTQTTGPIVELDNPYSPQPIFTAPLVDSTTTISFELIINDGTVDSIPSEVHVAILNMDTIPEGIVTNSNATGPGSLRAAVEYANANPGTRITFSIPDTDASYDAVTGVWSFAPPNMHSRWSTWIRGNGTFIDGDSQTDNWGDRNPYGPEIEISGGYDTFGIWADDVVIRGLVLNNPGNPAASISINGGTNIVITGNYIGTDPTGTQIRSPGNCGGNPYSGSHGIILYVNPVYGGAIDNVRIGGTTPGEGNIISGLGFAGIWLQGKVGFPGWTEGTPEIGSVTIQGNIIGPDRTGSIGLVDCGALYASTGIKSEFNRADLLIGGVTPGSRNLLSGWSLNIWLIKIAGRTRIQGNYIGTDITGTFPVPPTGSGALGIGLAVYDGLEDFEADQLLIGGSEPGAGNLISGNPSDGITLEDDYKYIGDVDVQGNLIGTDPTGTSAVPNGGNGIFLRWGVKAWIGGPGPGEGNVISGNSGWGIWQYDDWRAPYGRIKGNKIGLGADGVTPLGNGSGGIYVGMDSGAEIGSEEIGAGNIIAYNNGPGISFPGWWNNNYTAYRRGRPLILGNSIHSNTGLGIARAGSVQNNDAGDADLAVYHLQNFPVITEVTVENGMTRVTGELDTLKPDYCKIELFVNNAADSSGYGEGERWLVTFYPDVDGNFDVIIPENLSGSYLTATATRWIRDDGDPSGRSSEFSPAILVGDSKDTNLPPIISSSPETLVVAEVAYAYQVFASDPEGADLTYSLALAPDGMNIDADGLVTWQPTTAQEGSNVVTVVVRDDLGLLASQNFTITVLPLVDLEWPIISIPIPHGLAIEEPYDMVGTVQDVYLVNYNIEVALQGTDSWLNMGGSNQNVLNSLVGVIDPTRLANGLYNLRVIAIDESGHVTIFESMFEVTGKLKIGQFSLAFQDIAVPLSGIPISVIRSFNSLDKGQGDFGVGWDMTLGSGVNLQVTRKLGDDWYAVEDYFYDPGGTGTGAWVYALETDNIPKVLITYADGTQDRFEFRPDFVTQPAFDPRYVWPYFIPLEGTTSTLEAIADNDLLLYPWPAYPDGENLLDSDFEIYDPDLYRLTTAEGMELMISKSGGLQSITDLNGNTINFSPSGISHSGGLSIAMDRDAEGRITRITDPMGNEVLYAYDENEDLVEFTDKESNLTQFSYDEDHNLISIIDPRGIEILQVDYDEDGRMIGTVDGLGNPTNIFHDIDNAIEYITDRNGNTSAYEYDKDGNIISETDPLGDVTSYTYDDYRNKLTKTDPLGNTTFWTYDNRNNQLTETDPLGNTRYWSYNSRNQYLSTTDPLGNITNYTYDSNGNMLTKTDPLGNTVAYTYDSSGNVTSMTDCEGNLTAYTYDTNGYKLTKTDALGNITTYAYDSNGNRLSKTDAQGNTTTFVYDSLNRLMQTVDPFGNVSMSEYNDIGKKSAEVDKLGNRTEFDYDENGNLTTTTYPDGTSETNEHDANGNRISSTDRAGRVTQFEYDTGSQGNSEQVTLNRLVRIIHADGASIGLEYDALGRIAATVDENGNRKKWIYDAAGRTVQKIDALGNSISFTYDANGNRTSITDANGNTTAYTYDTLNRPVVETFADGTTITSEYSNSCALGYDVRKISKTDQAGNQTLFDYDSLGRLVRVIDPMGGQMTYSYDGVGNRIVQTDANGNTTSFVYDSLGRVVSKTLPLGQSEGFSYDGNGNLIIKTDFNGNATNYAYDVNGRLMQKVYEDGSEVSFTYTPTGQRATVTDIRGTTSYTYDVRDRFLGIVTPEGTSITYTYDLKGNRTAVTAPSGATAYDYDAINRLVSLQDPNGGTLTYSYDSAGNLENAAYPNGIIAEYKYDELNRLTDITNRRLTGEVISSHAYMLDSTGHRVSLTETDGRVIGYTYDSLYRLTQEEINDPGIEDKVFSYSYDAVGNRITKVEGATTMTYTYNANNQLLTETAPSFTHTYTYDDNGNMASRSDGTTLASYQYDFEDRLVGVSDGGRNGVIVYDVDGIRVGAETDGVMVRYVVDKNLHFAQVLEERDELDSLLTRYVYGHDLISQDRDGSVLYYHYDGQMSTRRLTDSAGAITDSYIFDAFGAPIYQSGMTVNNYLYTGEQYDPLTGWYYLRARYYDQFLGAFVSRDPFEGSLTEPLSLHPYLYALGDPINRVDPTGQFSIISQSLAASVNNILQGVNYGVVMATAVAFNSVMFGAGVVSSDIIAEWILTPGFGLYEAILISNVDYGLPDDLLHRTVKWSRQGIAVGYGGVMINVGIPWVGELGPMNSWLVEPALRRLSERVKEEREHLDQLYLWPPPWSLRAAMTKAINKWGSFCGLFMTQDTWFCSP